MMIMIINLLRVMPKLFINQIDGLRSHYEVRPGMRYIPRNIMLRSVDVESCINFLMISDPA